MRSKTPVNLDEIKAALIRVRKQFGPTPLLLSRTLSDLAGCEIYLKWENKLRTGSFKERGAVNFLSMLSAKERHRGVCAASAGNHALALSYYANKLKIPCHVVMPIHAPLVKVHEAIRQRADVILEGFTFDDAVAYGRKLAKTKGYTYVHAFDDERIIVGQGTAGLELHSQLPDMDTLICPVGGGGLLGGIASALRFQKHRLQVIGVQSKWALDARKSEYQKHFIRPVSIADGIAVKTPGIITTPILRRVVDKMVTASESELAQAIILMLEKERAVVEGAGAAGLVPILQGAIPKKAKKVCIIVCGSNIDTYTLARLIARDQGERGRLLQMVVSVPDRPGSLSKVAQLVAESQANVLDIVHDRSFCRVPGNVSITFLLEVRDSSHRKDVLKMIRSRGLEVKELDD